MFEEGRLYELLGQPFPAVLPARATPAELMTTMLNPSSVKILTGKGAE